MSKKLQQLLAFVFGVVFVIVLLLLAVEFPNPTQFQYEVFKVVLALAAAGVAAMIPGFLQLNVSTWLRAGGALAVFAVVYFYTPARFVVETAEPDPTAMYSIVLVCSGADGIQLNNFDFPYSDIKKNGTFEQFTTLVAKLPSQQCDQSGSKIFRMKDEVRLLSASSLSATEKGNLGAIVLPEKVIAELGGDDHLAFTKVNSRLKSR